jgi:hypothetical protein
MALVTINHRPTPQQLRTFSLCWLAFFGLWSTWAWWRHGPTTAVMAAALLSVGVPLVGQVWREGLRRVYVGMSYLTWPIGFVLSWLILAVVFYLVMTPIALVMRLVGYDPLERKWDPQAATYWVRRPPPPSPNQYFRQY